MVNERMYNTISSYGRPFPEPPGKRKEVIMSREKDIETVRELAKQYMEIALSDRHVKMRKRFKDSNDLKIVRPPVNIEELPWWEQLNIDHMLDCVCEDSELRGMEYTFKVALYREKFFKCDNFIEPFWVVGKSFSSTGNGFPSSRVQRLEKKGSVINSRHFDDVLEDESALENYHLPVITAYPENDVKNVAHVQEILGDTMPVQLRGQMTYYSPWDQLSELRGVEPILIDIYERPEYLHKLMKMITDAKMAEIEQMDALGLYDPRCPAIHCTPAEVTVPNGNTEEGTFRSTDVWFRTMAQMFNTVSPEVHYEFDIQYSIPLSEKFAYTYYGCCEPLSDRLDMIKRYKNLRKVGCSPWSDVNVTAEELGGNYVLSKKPNPAYVALSTDPEVVRKETEETVQACIRNGTPCDITLKDISTVSNKPENLIIWAETVSGVLDKYYGED